MDYEEGFRTENKT